MASLRSFNSNRPLHTVLAAILLVIGLARLAVAVPIISNHGQFVSAAGITTFTHAATTAGLNRGLWVSVGWNMTTGGNCVGPTISSVTYNGVAMTSITAGPSCIPATGWALQTFQLIAPTLGTNNVIVTFSGTTGAITEWFNAAGVSSVNPRTTIQQTNGGCSATLPTPQFNLTCNLPALPSNANNLNVGITSILNTSAGGSVSNIRVGTGETIFEIMQLLTNRVEGVQSSAEGTNNVMTWIADYTGGANVNSAYGGIGFGIQGGVETPVGLCGQLPQVGVGC